MENTNQAAEFSLAGKERMKQGDYPAAERVPEAERILTELLQINHRNKLAKLSAIRKKRRYQEEAADETIPETARPIRKVVVLRVGIRQRKAQQWLSQKRNEPHNSTDGRH